MENRLVARGVTVGYGERSILENLDVSIPREAVTAVIGPNGCGKSTLLKTLGRILHPHQGQVFLDGQDIAEVHTRTVAKKLSLLPQNPAAPPGISVRTLVARGRFPHKKWWSVQTQEDRAIVDRALERTGLLDLADHELDSLSGGQKQRAWIAMSLAQEAEILLLDEPTNHLDLVHQIEVMDLVRSFPDAGKTVVLVLHDLNIAARYSDYVIAMNAGQIMQTGPVNTTLTSQLLKQTFDLEAKVFVEEETQLPVVLPLA